LDNFSLYFLRASQYNAAERSVAHEPTACRERGSTASGQNDRKDRLEREGRRAMNNAIRLGLIGLLLLFSAAAADAAEIASVDVKDYGVYSYDEKSVAVETSKTGAESGPKLTNIRLVEKTYRVPKAPKTFFSIEFLPNGAPKEQGVEIELRLKSPKGDVSKGLMLVIPGRATATSIEFSEMDPVGVYHLSIFYKGKELLAKDVTLYQP
jgi:hypothetical protein